MTHQVHFAEQADNILVINDVSATNILAKYVYISISGKDDCLWQHEATEDKLH